MKSDEKRIGSARRKTPSRRRNGRASERDIGEDTIRAQNPVLEVVVQEENVVVGVPRVTVETLDLDPGLAAGAREDQNGDTETIAIEDIAEIRVIDVDTTIEMIENGIAMKSFAMRHTHKMHQRDTG
tara:strand:+ start:293 stop:673 length:381 start_codon:yes stop_codon:yes gene_type:complete